MKEKINILMLEDSEDDALLLLSTLNQSGLSYQHHHVYNQFEFVERLKLGEPDIILSDYGLKGYNGLAALKDTKEHGIRCPFILVTGSLPDEIAVECLKAGVDDYVLKDRLSRLPDAIRQVMDRQHAEAERRRVFSELIRSQKRLEAAERMAKVGNWEWHPETQEIIWSDEMYNIVGADRDSFVPTVEKFLKLLSDSDAENRRKVAQKITEGKQEEGDAQFRLATLQGETKMVRSIFRTNGKRAEKDGLKVFGTLQDITLQFLTERALRDLSADLEKRVEERTHALSLANEQLKRKNDEMTDSINYAKLIQKALLAKLEECRKLFPKSFVLWKPRDIVSGDFYWHYRDGDFDYIAAVDCTGHGVPGAFMSMIGHQLLNQVVIRRGISEPGEVLTELNKSVDEALHVHGGLGVKDGMDIIFCRIDRKKRQVCFSGALRPLFHVGKNGLVEYPGNRSPIGNFKVNAHEENFTQNCIEYQEGDTIYLTSDGYYSQFGGPKGKKMMKSRFKELISEIAGLSIDEQYGCLLSRLEDWQGEEEQVDDILIVGIQF